jgi:hypothetical protein
MKCQGCLDLIIEDALVELKLLIGRTPPVSVCSRLLRRFVAVRLRLGRRKRRRIVLRGLLNRDGASVFRTHDMLLCVQGVNILVTQTRAGRHYQNQLPSVSASFRPPFPLIRPHICFGSICRLNLSPMVMLNHEFNLSPKCSIALSLESSAHPCTPSWERWLNYLLPGFFFFEASLPLSLFINDDSQ